MSISTIITELVILLKLVGDIQIDINTFNISEQCQCNATVPLLVLVTGLVILLLLILQPIVRSTSTIITELVILLGLEIIRYY